MTIIEHKSAEERATFLRTWYQLTRKPIGLQGGAL